MKRKLTIGVVITIFLLAFIYLIPNKKITTISINNKIKLTAATESGFADENFYSCILEAAGAENGTILTSEQLSNITEVVCENKGITNVSGIEKLTSLQNLDLYNNNISNINVSANTLLRYINLSSNKLSSLDLSNNINLQHIYASGNNISNIKLPNTDTITRLDLHYNKITSLNLQQFINLEYLILSANQLSSIDLSKNTALTELHIGSNNLTSLDISPLINLQHFNAVLNNFDSPNIPYPEKMIDIA